MSCNDGVSDFIICTPYEQLVSESRAQINSTSNFTFHNFILVESSKSLSTVNFHYIFGMEKMEQYRTINVTAFYNNQPYHSPPIALNFLMNAIFREITSNNKKRINVNNYPLPSTTADDLSNPASITTTGFLLGFSTIFGLNFLVSSLVVFLIKERESKAKLLQFVSGAGFLVFWMSNFIFDFLLYLATSIIIVIVIASLQIKTLMEEEALTSAFVLLIVYGWAVIPLMYLASFFLTVPAVGFSRIFILNLVTGVAPFLTVIILEIPSLEMLNTVQTLNWVFLIFPNYNLGYGMKQIGITGILYKICPKIVTFCNLPKLNTLNKTEDEYPNPCCTDYPYDYLDFHPAGIGRNILSLFITGLLCFVILLVVEGKLFQKFRCKRRPNQVAPETHRLTDDPAEDPDVAAEAKKIRSSDEADLFISYPLVVRNLTKRYGSFTAVQCLNLGVKKRECFGLLGVNGAGKTTTFKMLTGDLSPSSGDAFVCGHSITSDIKSVQKNLGYCPQFDALIDDLTGRETIRLFARLRGIKEKDINKLTEKLGESLLFSEHMDKRVKTYSGGNKRKLSTAVALIGHPPLVFLDEPTTGMDPVARRHLWNCVTKVRKSGTSVILTSHSMEECEALCTRLVIMVNGEFCCLGSTTRLKSKFGKGYTITAQIVTKTAKNKQSVKDEQIRRSTLNSGILLPPPEWQIELKPLRRFIEGNFPGANLKDAHPGYLHYHLTNPELTWGLLFRKMEEAKATFHLEAYCVGQTSLEQIFLNFAKGQATDE